MKRWTKDEEDLLKVFIETKWLYKDIANELDRSVASIKHKASYLKIKSKNNRIPKTTAQYKKELKEKCPTMLCIEDYKDYYTKILHKCLKCEKEYLCTPNSKLDGWGCKFCGTNNNSGDIPVDKKGITYLVYIPKYNLYKIGITSKTVKERMSDNRIYVYDLILEHKFQYGKDAIKLEKQWKKNLRGYLVNTRELKSGNTETFRF